MQYIILILLFLLPLLHSELFLLSNEFLVKSNYELPKTSFLAIYMWIIWIYILYKIFCKEEKYYLNKKIFIFILLFFCLILFSTIFSLSIYLSIFWWFYFYHWLIFFFNLILFFILINNIKEEKFNKKVENILFIWWIIIWIYWIVLEFIPTLNSWELSWRMISSLWHPNYLWIYFFSLIFLSYYNLKKDYKNKKYIILTLIFIIFLLFTKSLTSFIIFLLFIINEIYLLFKPNKKIYWLSSLFIILVFIALFIIFYPEKLPSFISRYYIYKSILIGIFSDIKTFLIWWGLDTLDYTFDKYKVPELYIFENIWKTANRSHNLLIDFFYFWWIWLFIWLSYLYYFIFNNLNKWIYFLLVFFICIFCLLNPVSSVIFILIVLFTALSLKNKKEININIFVILLSIISIIWWYFKILEYKSEMYSFKRQYQKSLMTFKYNPNNYYKLALYDKKTNYKLLISDWLAIWGFKNYDYYKTLILTSPYKDKYKNCNEFTNKFNSAEFYFLCWHIFYDLKDERYKEFYSKWLSLIPDLWNDNSEYNNRYFVKRAVAKWRIFSEKYWLSIVLDRMNIKYNRNVKYKMF